MFWFAQKQCTASTILKKDVPVLVAKKCMPLLQRNEKVFRIGTVRYTWPMSAHASQAFSIAHCTDSEDWPKNGLDFLVVSSLLFQWEQQFVELPSFLHSKDNVDWNTSFLTMC